MSAPLRVPLRGATASDFVSHLIAARDHLETQRHSFRAQPDRAIAAYADGASKAVRRMPMGYRTTRTV
ncbi:hypothetical protein [Devosia sp.]|uniref:hypothetical protein n=1 Tax=Devosia sp. TaxID=1871048 RepID=UPI003A92DB9B